MNRAVEYLEANLTEKLDIEKVAKIVLSSTFHFQRMYHMMTGVTIAEYVRRRRLTLAAQDISSGKKIIDVAYRYGYETPEAFTKAFGKMHGISPSAARELGANLKAYPKLSFHISIKGDEKMNYKVVDKGSFRVVGKQRRITLVDGENFIQVPEFWNECIKDGSYQWISSKAGKLGVLGVAMDFSENGFNYLIGVEEIKDTLPIGYISATIPASTYAVFESVGALPTAIKDIIQRIYTEWFPATGYQHDCYAPTLEVYPKGDMHSPDYRCEVWVPVKKQKR
ncbi:AraC family transcriptional regulator [Desulfosporosinus sp. OT]|uniref:AraC family transcriptional regulator n=1 Tax=Desulfosporosinus sp. OT TaxID=913865 RepID=UPI0002239B67|nr:AraC family transcriptional regulator [Desulfosporosinus sp. OT]EGW38758.1 bacterial regulatory helix-turn-helix s, AraC family protein [Desulfosporosinus sp. OT]